MLVASLRFAAATAAASTIRWNVLASLAARQIARQMERFALVNQPVFIGRLADMGNSHTPK
jgi:hypothetical protein